jgi:hypothetical protein
MSLHPFARRRTRRLQRISKRTGRRGLTARLALLAGDVGGFVFPAGDSGCTRLQGVAGGCTALHATAVGARDRMCHPAPRWVRFAKSIVRVNQRQLASTGVTLCQPRGGGDRAVGSFFAGAISGTCGDIRGYCATSSTVARGHSGTSGVSRRADGTFGRIRDLDAFRRAATADTPLLAMCIDGNMRRFANRA